MRKLVLTLAALAAVGVALPAVSNTANAETVVIKKTYRDNGWHRHHHHDRVVVREKYRHRNYHHGARVGVGTTGVGVVIR
jgi:Ni/Co efflux regulator RcnB